MKYPTLQQSINAAIVILIVAVIGYAAVTAVQTYYDAQSQVKKLSSQVESKDTEIAALRTNLSVTEEGKKQVEEAKKASDANASTQASRAKSAEADAANKSAQLSNVNSQLNTANAQLANVNRCVAAFDNLAPTIRRYQSLQVSENDAYSKQVDYANASDYSSSNYWNSIGRAYTDQANNLWPVINSTLSNITLGVCY